MAKIGSVSVEIKPTVSLESAVACVMMLNLFLDDNDEYRLVQEGVGDRAGWTLTNRPKVSFRFNRDDFPEDAVMKPISKEAYDAFLGRAGLNDIGDCDD